MTRFFLSVKRISRLLPCRIYLNSASPAGWVDRLSWAMATLKKLIINRSPDLFSVPGQGDLMMMLLIFFTENFLCDGKKPYIITSLCVRILQNDAWMIYEYIFSAVYFKVPKKLFLMYQAIKSYKKTLVALLSKAKEKYMFISWLYTEEFNLFVRFVNFHLFHFILRHLKARFVAFFFVPVDKCL